MAGNPSLTQLRAGWEKNGIGFEGLTLPHSIPFVSETLSAEVERIESATIETGGEMSESELGKIPVNGQTVHELDAENHVLFLAASMGLGETPVSVDAPNSVTSHKLSRTESDVTFDQSYSVEVNKDDGNPIALLGGALSSLQLALAPSTFNLLTLEHHFESACFYDMPNEEVPGATANDFAPQVRSVPDYDTIQLADGDIWLQVDDASGVPGEVVFLAKVGAAASYGATTFTVTTGLNANGQPIWTPIIDSNTGRAIGTLGHEIEVAVVDDTGYEDLDEWSYARDRDVWVNSFADVPKLTEVHAVALLNGAEFELEGATITHNLLGNPYMTIGRRWARRIDQLGQRSYSIELNRRYTDTELWHRVITGATVSLRFDMYGKSYIGTGVERHRVSLVYPRVVFAGRGPSVDNQETIQETATGSAHPDPGNVDGYTAAATIEIQGTVPDLTV